MRCERAEKSNEERYAKDFKKAVLLKLKAAASPSPDIMTEANRELAELCRQMADYSGKTSETIECAVNKRFSEIWEAYTEEIAKERKSRCIEDKKAYSWIQLILRYI